MTRADSPADNAINSVLEPQATEAGKPDQKTLQNVEGRLSRIEGQIRGIRNMSAEGRGCVDIVTQIAAVRAALKKVGDVVVADHVQQWLDKTTGAAGNGEHDVEELLKVFNQYYR